MEAAYLYSKPRSEFGKDVRACLRVSSPRLLAHLPGLGPEEATALVARQYVRRNPCSTEVDNTPSMYVLGVCVVGRSIDRSVA